MVATVTFQDGTTIPNGGFSIQLNAYNPPASDGTDWMQYILLVAGNAITAFVQYHNTSAETACIANCNSACADAINVQQCRNQCRFSCRHVTFNSNSPVIPMLPSNAIPAGYVFEIDLNNDSSGNIMGATFEVTDNNGNKASTTIPVDASHLFTIEGFQVNVVGPDNRADSNFSSGTGVITYTALGQLVVEGGLPDMCIGSGALTGETSNVKYGMVGPPCCSGEIVQSFSL